jgi:hypothetical protein
MFHAANIVEYFSLLIHGMRVVRTYAASLAVLDSIEKMNLQDAPLNITEIIRIKKKRKTVNAQIKTCRILVF